jgi:hypothetical protein
MKNAKKVINKINHIKDFDSSYHVANALFVTAMWQIMQKEIDGNIKLSVRSSLYEQCSYHRYPQDNYHDLVWIESSEGDSACMPVPKIKASIAYWVSAHCQRRSEVEHNREWNFEEGKAQTIPEALREIGVEYRTFTKAAKELLNDYASERIFRADARREERRAKK